MRGFVFVYVLFLINERSQVLYDDNEWYPGEIVAYTETTGKFRFKLTEVTNLTIVVQILTVSVLDCFGAKSVCLCAKF